MRFTYKPNENWVQSGQEICIPSENVTPTWHFLKMPSNGNTFSERIATFGPTWTPFPSRLLFILMISEFLLRQNMFCLKRNSEIIKINNKREGNGVQVGPKVAILSENVFPFEGIFKKCQVGVTFSEGIQIS